MSMMKIVSLLDSENPRISEMFTSDFRQKIKIIDSKTIDIIKEIVKNYIDENLAEYLVNYKIYAYKFIDSIVVEIFLKPIETANIMEYHLHISKDESKLERIR